MLSKSPPQPASGATPATSPMAPQNSMTDTLHQPKTRSGSAKFSQLSYEIKGVRIVDNVSVDVRQGEMLAILGPSGAGKSTLLDLMSHRKKPMEGGVISLGGRSLDRADLALESSYVEQNDDHYGVLTVRETIEFAYRLRFGTRPTADKLDISGLIHDLGLQSCEHLKIGTPVQRGISGGQKRRVTVGTGVVTLPSILFLDEPTSGLDSASALEVMAAVKRIAVEHNIAVICTIHAPSTDTLSLFETIMVLSRGRVAFKGSVPEAEARCAAVGQPIPPYTNPAEHLLALVNTDFGGEGDLLQKLYDVQEKADGVDREKSERAGSEKGVASLMPAASANHSHSSQSIGHTFRVMGVLADRSFLNYSRNWLAYLGVRLGMYIGMGILLATIWAKLGDSDGKINDRLSVHFFAVAFLAFMSVAGIPSFLEERSVFLRERRNGLYGPGAFTAVNTLLSLPFLFTCTLLFCVIVYWSIGLAPGATHFFRFLAFLFMALFAAETQVALVAALIPIFVAALAVAAFMNGFWMCVQGYFIRARNLPRFWRYSFHYMDYQKYAFELLVKNDLAGEVFPCDSATLPTGGCNCVYPASQLTLDTYGQCAVTGQDVIDYLQFGGISMVQWSMILLCIIVIFRVALYLALRYRR